MKVLRLVPLVLILAACSSVKMPLSPYRIDVQQGNALEQESVEKLKPGLTRSQVRFLLGTPLVVDPFHRNRWDYVYNFRKAGKLTEERRLVLFFDGEVLVLIEGEGFPPKGELPASKPPLTAKPVQKPVEPEKPAVVETAAVVVPPPLETAKPVQPVSLAAEAAAKPAPAPQPQAKPAAETPAPAAAQVSPAKAAGPPRRRNACRPPLPRRPLFATHAQLWKPCHLENGSS